MMVVTALAVSWKPLTKSKAYAKPMVIKAKYAVVPIPPHPRAAFPQPAHRTPKEQLAHAPHDLSLGYLRRRVPTLLTLSMRLECGLHLHAAVRSNHSPERQPRRCPNLRALTRRW